MQHFLQFVARFSHRLVAIKFHATSLQVEVSALQFRIPLSNPKDLSKIIEVACACLQDLTLERRYGQVFLRAHLKEKAVELLLPMVC